MAITITSSPNRSRDGNSSFYVAIENGIWFTFTASGSPQETGVLVEVVNSDTLAVINQNDIILLFGTDGTVSFDVSPYLQDLLSNVNDNDYQDDTTIDTNASIKFFLRYQEYPEVSPASITSSNDFIAVKASKNYLDEYGQNMAKYVPFASQTDLSEFLTYSKDLPFWDGYVLDISAIYNNVAQNYYQLEYDELGTLLSTNIFTFTTNDDVNHVTITKQNSDTAKIEIYLDDQSFGIEFQNGDSVEFQNGDTTEFQAP